MYFSALSDLSGCDEVRAMLATRGPFTQSFVDDIWQQVADGPAPFVPASMVGMFFITPPRGRPLITPTKMSVGDAIKAVAKGTGGAHGATKSEMDFINFFNQAVADPCRKQSLVSKVAGGIIKVAEVAIPAAGIMSAVTTAGNAALDQTKASNAENLAARVLAPSYAAQTNTLQAAQADAFAAQLEKLKSLGVSSTGVSAPIVSKSVPVSEKIANRSRLPLAVAVGALLLLASAA